LRVETALSLATVQRGVWERGPFSGSTSSRLLRVVEELFCCELAGRISSSRGESVVLQQSAERFMADNVLPTEVFHRFARRQVAGDGHIAQALVRAEFMIIGQPSIEDVPKVPLAENDEVVQHLVLGALHPGFGEWVHVRTPRRNRP